MRILQAMQDKNYPLEEPHPGSQKGPKNPQIPNSGRCLALANDHLCIEEFEGPSTVQGTVWSPGKRGDLSLSLLEVQRSSLRRTAEQQPKANFYSPHLCSVAWEACNRTERTALGASAAIKGLAVRDPWLFMECLKWLERSLLTILHLKGYDYVRKM